MLNESAQRKLTWNAMYRDECDRDTITRRHSPVCTEIMMKGYRCMKKSHGDRSQCQDLFDALTQCRYPDSMNNQREPTV